MDLKIINERKIKRYAWVTCIMRVYKYINTNIQIRCVLKRNEAIEMLCFICQCFELAHGTRTLWIKLFLVAVIVMIISCLEFYSLNSLCIFENADGFTIWMDLCYILNHVKIWFRDDGEFRCNLFKLLNKWNFI